MRKYLKENMEAEFGYRTEKIAGGASGAASAVDERGAAIRAQRNGDREELERDARNAGSAVSAADAVGRRPENAADEAGGTGSPGRDADVYRGIRETGWEPEREVFFRLQGADRQYAKSRDYDFREQQTGDFCGAAGTNEENLPVRMDLDYGGDLVRSAPWSVLWSR